MNRRTAVATLILFALALPPAARAIVAGVARIDVTPPEPIRLTGFGNRKTNSIGVQQKLWAKALALGSDRDGPSVLITLDNCGIAESTYRSLVSRLTRRTRLKQAGIVIACSHTHCGPCTTDWAPNIFAADIPPAQQATIDRYTQELLGKLESVALEALKERRPSQLAWAQGEAGFARNRRVVVGKTAQFGNNAAGPVDQALPVLRVTDSDGKLRAIVANYACHCTTLGGEFNHVCGDWAGYAQEAIEREEPDAVALITIGCGADSNPSPRGGTDFGLALAKQHGEEIAGEVKRLLGLTFTPLTGKLTTRLKEIRLPFGPQFTRDEWQSRATNSGINGYHARKWLARLDRGEKPPNTLYYPISCWRFGDDLAMVFLPGEVVVDYALRLKQDFDPARLWVSSYSHYVPCYIPSRRILAEGGYEAEQSLWYYDRPTRISTNAEDLIIKTVHDLLPKPFLFDRKKAEFPDPLTPKQALGAFRTHADLTVELVVSEPLIESPVAIDWDAQGRLWVCEMYDYPTGLNPPADTGRKWGENPPAHAGGYKPGGRIKVLTSSKNDGHYDQATVFLDSLPFPTGVMPWRKGALICAAPNILYAEDTDGDGRADVVRTNFTGFATHNFQARVNGFRWGLDGWLHGSSGLFGGKVKSLITGKEVDLGGRDFRIQADTGEIEPLAGVSQMGRVRDDFDNWFGNDNSTLLWHYPLADHYMRRNPYVTYPDPRVNVTRAGSGGVRDRGSEGIASSHSLNTPLPHPRVAADPHLLYPASRTLERFNSPESANHVTSACGIDIYRDVLLGSSYHGNAFICEPVHNLVTRLVLEPDGVTFAGHRAPEEQHSEFLASTDNWFRPVQVRTGPDGALWVVDMYRFVIEHPRWIAPERLKTLDVRAGADLGRIYRVYPKGAKLRSIEDLTRRHGRQLAEALETPNGTTRDLVHRELVRTKDASLEGIEPALERIVAKSEIAAARAQAIGVLAELGLYNVEAQQRALGDPDPNVVRAAIRADEWLAAPDAKARHSGRAKGVDVLTNQALAVQFQLALTYGARVSDVGPVTNLLLMPIAWTVARNQSEDPWFRAACLASATNAPDLFLKNVFSAQKANDSPGLMELAKALISTEVAIHDSDGLAHAWQEALRWNGPALPEAHRAQLAGIFLEALDRQRLGWREFLAAAEGKSPSRADMVRDVDSLLSRARELVLNREGNLAEASLLGYVSLLGTEPSHVAEDTTILRSCLNSSPSPALERAVLARLRRMKSPSVPGTLLSGWKEYLPSVRSRVLGLLLEREDWTQTLLAFLREGALSPAEVPLANRQALLTHQVGAIREQASTVFAAQRSASRVEVLARFGDLAGMTPVADRGAALFEKNCAQCHAYRGHGHAVGPNLAEFAGKSIADFVQAILDPSSAINPNYLAYIIDTKDGRSLTGIVRGENASGFTLVQGGGIEEKLLRSEVQHIRASSLSLMPEGIEQALTPQDVADLIAWLKQGAPAPFGTASANAELAARNRAEFFKLNPSIATAVIAPETLPYRSWLGTLPMAYCRQTAGVNRLTWQSERRAPARRDSSHSQHAEQGLGAPGALTFRFPAAMGFASQPQGKFTLHVNGQPVLDFDVALADGAWSSADGRVRMIYTVMEANAEDSNGLLVIEVATSSLEGGQAVQFEVTGSDSHSQRWFGIYRLER